MAIIDQIVKKNTKQNPDTEKPCQKCGHGVQWKPSEVVPWRCAVCSPPRADAQCKFLRVLGGETLRPTPNLAEPLADLGEWFQGLPEPMGGSMARFYRGSYKPRLDYQEPEKRKPWRRARSEGDRALLDNQKAG